jgi:hypothetical protein
MAGLDMAGRRSLSMNWTASGIAFETAPWIPDQLSPDYILADMILIYWPADIARHALSNATLTATGKHRGVIKDGIEIIAIDYVPAQNKDIWQSHVHYQNLARGYTLDIQSSRVTP